MKNDIRRASRLAALLFSLLLALTALPFAVAAPDPANYRLTEATIARLKAVEAELKPIGGKDKRSDKASANRDDEVDSPNGNPVDQADSQVDEDEDDDTSSPAAGQGGGSDGKKDDSIEGIAAKVEANPQVKAALAKQGLTPIDYALATHAMLHAGMFVMFEQAMDPQKAQALLSGYTPAQRDNIDIVRRTFAASR